MSKVLKNTAYLGATRLFARFLGLMGTFVVARLLTPDDYAVIATCMIVQDLALRLEDIGFGQNLISKNKLTNKFIGSLLNVRLFVGVLLFGITYSLAGIAGDFFESSDVTSVLEIIAFIFIIKPFTNINIVLASRKQNFLPSIKAQLFSKIISVITTILLAYTLESFWALALGMVMGALLYVAFSYIVYKPMWPIHFSLNEAKNIFGFSKWFTLNQLVEFFNGKSNIFLVAKIFEKKLVGFFSLGSEICLMYAMEVSHAIDRSNLVALADKKRKSKKFDKDLLANLSFNLALKSLLLFPVYLVFIIYPEFVIKILLGDNWLEMAPYFQLFSIGAMLFSFASTFQNVLVVYRKPEVSFYISFCCALLRFPLLYLSYIYSNAFILIAGSAVLQFIRMLLLQAALICLSKISFVSINRFVIRELAFFSICFAIFYAVLYLLGVDSILVNIVFSQALLLLLFILISKVFPKSELSLLCNIILNTALVKLKSIRS